MEDLSKLMNKRRAKPNRPATCRKRFEFQEISGSDITHMSRMPQFGFPGSPNLPQLRLYALSTRPLPQGMREMWRQAVHYRNRAELLRSIAKETNHEAHKQAL